MSPPNIREVQTSRWTSQLVIKIAVIAAGIAHRARVGAATGPGFDTAGEAVGTYIDLGLHTLDMVGGAK